MGDQRIPEIAIDCQNAIANLLAAAKSEDCCVKDFLHGRDVQQMQERYDQWAGNLGALQPFESSLSLEHRLRDSPLVRNSILSTLLNLYASVKTGRNPSTPIIH